MLTRQKQRLAQQGSLGISRAAPTRVLVDLSHAADGFVGVAQDLRLIFAMLCGLEGVEATGLLMASARHDLPRVHARSADRPALTAAVLHWMERNWSQPEPGAPAAELLRQFRTLRQMLRVKHHLLPLAERSQMNAIWRVLFAKTLLPEQREIVLARDFVATDLSVAGIIDFCVHPPVPLRKHLDARHFDAVLFCMPRPVRLPRGVRQLMRFHDAVPVTDADTVGHWKMAVAQSRLIRACDPDAIFICNSPQSRDMLIGLDPKREAHAVVIPCAVAPPHVSLRGISPCAVIERHVTFRALGPGRGGAAPREAAPGWAAPTDSMRYVLSVSTLEPRKNFPGLIRAWERVVARSDPDLRLVIVGEAGWCEETILAEMRPGVASGQILHLQHLPQEELQALMRGAACFAFPSFGEGFGYTPLEAMQAGAPCVVSDLPVFRWIFGDAAIYVDPYDSDSIATGIERLATLPGRRELSAQLQNSSEHVLARFRPASIAQAWEALLQSSPISPSPPEKIFAPAL
jgi:glycosyltransferase involved in cell wall biosynthesis